MEDLLGFIRYLSQDKTIVIIDGENIYRQDYDYESYYKWSQFNAYIILVCKSEQVRKYFLELYEVNLIIRLDHPNWSFTHQHLLKSYDDSFILGLAMQIYYQLSQEVMILSHDNYRDWKDFKYGLNASVCIYDFINYFIVCSDELIYSPHLMWNTNDPKIIHFMCNVLPRILLKIQDVLHYIKRDTSSTSEPMKIDFLLIDDLPCPPVPMEIQFPLEDHSSSIPMEISH